MDEVRNKMHPQGHAQYRPSAVDFLPFACVTRSRIQWISSKSERDVSFKFLRIYTVICTF